MEKYEIDKTKEISEIINELDSIFDLEVQNMDKNNEITGNLVDLKGLSTETLIAVFRHCFQKETILNYSVITNIGLLVNGYNTLDDSMFENPEVWFTDMEQLIDVKLDLSMDIVEFQTKITYWFLSCIKSASKLEYVYLDEFVDIPIIFKRILLTTPLLNLSHIFAKSNAISTDKLPLVRDGYPVMIEICKKVGLSFMLLEEISKRFEVRNVDERQENLEEVLQN